MPSPATSSDPTPTASADPTATTLVDPTPTASQVPPAPDAADRAGGAARGRWTERGIEGLIRLAGLSTIVIIALIFIFLLREGASAFLDLPPRQLLSSRWYPIEAFYGFMPLLVGSLIVTIGAVIIAVPLGLTTAIYLGEIAPARQVEILKPLIEVLAGIPSIVLGFLGWVVLAPLVQAAGAPTGLTGFTGSLILAYMALPTIISISEDALYAVPKAYRDGALAIGATKWQTTWRVVLPAARSGLVIAVMLGVGRAIGETMAVMMVTGNAANIPPLGLGMGFEPVRTMTATIAAEMGEVERGSLHYSTLFALGIVLFVITFLINSLASWLVGGQRPSRRREF